MHGQLEEIAYGDQRKNLPPFFSQMQRKASLKNGHGIFP
jgi:hypothetical protein